MIRRDFCLQLLGQLRDLERDLERGIGICGGHGRPNRLHGDIHRDADLVLSLELFEL